VLCVLFLIVDSLSICFFLFVASSDVSRKLPPITPPTIDTPQEELNAAYEQWEDGLYDDFDDVVRPNPFVSAPLHVPVLFLCFSPTWQ
jgi:hypothetical protein